MTTPPPDLQAHVERLDEAGLLLRIDRPINKDTELHPLVRWQFLGGLDEDARKAFLFTNVTDGAGRRYGMPVLIGALAASPRIYGIGMGRPVGEIGDAWTRAIADPVPPEVVTDAPCQEIVVRGDDLRRPDGGLAALPVPVSTPGFDSAPYLTATMCITRDPETGVQNSGMYRAALKASDRMAVRMAAKPGGAGGWLHWLKHRESGEPMPIAIALGGAPAVIFTAPQKLPVGLDEFAVAGGLLGGPVRVVRCVTNDLVVPADAEIVIEGVIDPGMLEPEAPFGESNGYVALEAYNMPMRVTAITHRQTPIFNAVISQVTPSESSVIKKVAYEPLFLDHLKRTLSIKGIRKVAMHERLTNLRPVMFLQFERGAPRTEVWRGLYGAASFMGSVGKIIAAVSEDIDPTSVDAILWSIAYRSNPEEDMVILPNRGLGQGGQYEPGMTDSGLLIDATQKKPLAPLALPTRPYMEQARAIWEELGLPALRPDSPWHGYALGRWSDRWDLFADRAARGAWAETGEETARECSTTLQPETPRAPRGDQETLSSG